MKKITSRLNPEVKAVAALHHAKYRTKEQQFIAEGTRVCTTLVQAGHQPIAMYATELMLPIAHKLALEKTIVLVTSDVMEKMSAAKTPSGLLSVFPMPPQPRPDQLDSGIVLVHIADPGNMGTLMRSCAAMGCDSVVVIEGTDPWSPKVIQASAGTIGHVTIFNWSWDELIKNKGEQKLCALVVSGGKKPNQINNKKILFVIGSEAHGIPFDWIKQCYQTVTIPMPGKTESLNAAVAGSIILYVHATAHTKQK